MADSKFYFSTNAPRARRLALLAAAWCGGMLAGRFLSNPMPGVDDLWLRAGLPGVSPVGLAGVILFPLIVSAIAVSFSAPLALLPLAFGKAFGLSYCSCRVLAAYGSAGWLVRGLLLFSDSCMSVVLLWFWSRNIAGAGPSTRKDLALCGGLAVLIGCVDYFAVAPFLETLL